MTPSTTLIALIGELLLSGAVLLLIITAGALLFRRQWQHAPFLAPVYGMLVCGVIGCLAFAAWLLTTAGGFFAHAGRAFDYAVVLACLVAVCILGPRAVRERKTAGGPRGDVVVVSLLVIVAVAVSIGLLMLWTSADSLFPLARSRFLGLPIDNELPSAYASKLYEHLDPRNAVAGWLSSDRPQLQTGLLLLVEGLVNRGPQASGALHFATGVLAQSSWVLGAYALVRALRLRPFASSIGVLFTAVSGSLVVNTVFTWPKLLSAGMMIGGLAVLLEAGRRRDRSAWPMIALGVAVALGLLAHGAALFALPVVLVALIAHRSLWQRRTLLLGAVGAAAVYVPWLLYQRLYDPPGDRLLKYHLAAHREVTDASLLSVLRSAYGRLSWEQILHNKLANLFYPFSVPPWRGVSLTGVDVRMRVAAEFRFLDAALGLGLIVVLVITVRAILRRTRRRDQLGEAGRADDTAERQIVMLLVGEAVALVFWSVLMFGPGTTPIHLGSHVLVIIPMVAPVAWVAGRHPRTAVVLLALQTALTVKTYGPLLGASHWHRLPAALLTGGLVAAAALLVVLAARERAQRLRPVPRLPLPRQPRTDEFDVQPPIAREFVALD